MTYAAPTQTSTRNNPKLRRLFPDGGKQLIGDYFQKVGAFHANHHFIVQRIAQNQVFGGGTLARLMDVPVRELLVLNQAVSKRRFQSAGYTYAQFERKYAAALSVVETEERFEKLLLVDDVSTYG
ncbi:MAG: hypothetical protein GEU75_08230 [Dehalococcoidia bacterium]|nr:hypothetical protein [Dehalococcoidia bacterium]